MSNHFNFKIFLAVKNPRAFSVKCVMPFLISILGFFGPAGWAYYPGSPDRNLAVLQTAKNTPPR